MDRAHFCSVFVVKGVCRFNVRKGVRFEIVVVVTSQVPQICHVAAARSDKEPLSPVELGEVDLTRAVSILVFLEEIDSKLRIRL